MYLPFAILLSAVGVNADRLGNGLNILMIISDDLRPEIASWYDSGVPYMNPRIVTPNLDRLTAKSIIFKRAYVQQAICSPSRTSILTGRRPDTTHVYDLLTYFRESGGNFTTLPQYFKNHGYHSVGVGKVFHPGPGSGFDDPPSWSEPVYHAPSDSHWNVPQRSWYAVPPEEREEYELPDTQLTDYAIDLLAQFSNSSIPTDGSPFNASPFFLALGLHKPHLPFIFPEEYLDFYPETEVELPATEVAPIGLPVAAWWTYPELMVYGDIWPLNASGAIHTQLPQAVTKQLRRAYYASVSYMDNEVGRVLDALQNLNLENNTIVVFLSDHGWQLGEYGEWCKHTNFELATHSPMMISIPGKTDSGLVSEDFVEFVDLFPTLVDAAGLPAVETCPQNSSEVDVCHEGYSLLPLIDGTAGQWKTSVFSQYTRTIAYVDLNSIEVMGYSLRTSRYRYTEWVKFTYEPLFEPDWGFVVGVELYDDVTEPGETWNFADMPSYQEVRANLSAQLRLGWRQHIY